MRVLFRTDGGSGIGLGHLQRCLSLAEALKRHNATSFFLVHGDDDAVERARLKGFGAEASPAKPATPDDVEACLDVARRLRCDIIVVDSYLTDDAFLAALRDGGLYVVSIDDLNAAPFSCQMVIASGPQAPASGYRSARDDTRFLLGPQHAILRPEYWDAPLPQPKPAVRNVLVTTGGADPGNLLPSWLEALDTIDDTSISFTAIIGPFFTNPGDVHDAAAACSHTVRVVPSPAVMRPIQAAADLAVSAAGQTLYELCALRVPTVAVEIAANQRPQLTAFAAAGALIDAGASSDGSHNEGASGRLAAAVAELIADPVARRTVSDAAGALVDRRGALTVAREILASAKA